VVYIPEWRPDDPADVGKHPEQSSGLALVARKNS
jgi:hypothetical protein